MRGAGCWVLLLLGVVACASPVISPRVPAPPLQEARVAGVFDPSAQVEGRPGVHASEPLRVLDVQPVDRSRGEPIQLRFDRPVAAVDALPEARLVVELQERDGAWTDVAGQSAWTRADRLRFDPRTPLPGAHHVRVRLEGAVAGLEDVTWSFDTPRPQLERVEDWWALRGNTPILLWCDEALSPAVLAEQLHVYDEGGHALAVRVAEATDADREYADDERAGSLLAVHPAARWPRGQTLRVTVDAAFRTDAGVLPLGEPLAWSVETLPPFRFGGIRCADGTSGACPRGPITLALGNDPESVDDIRMRPEPPNFSAYLDEEGVVLDGEFESRSYTVILPAGLKDEEDQRIEGPRTRRVRFTEAMAPGLADLRLSSVAGVFAGPDQARIGVRSDRVRTAEVRLAVLAPEDAVPYLQPTKEPVPWPEDAITTRLELTFAAGGTEVLDLGRFAGRGDTVLVEVRSLALAENTENEQRPVRGVFRISGLGVWSHSGPARGVVRVTALGTGHPVAGAQVDAVEADGTRVLGRTSAQGLLALPGAVELDAPAVLVVRTADDAFPLPLQPFPWGVDFRRWCRTNRSGRCTYRSRPGFPPVPPAEAPPAPLRRGEYALVEIGIGRAVFMPGETVHVAGWAGISTPHGEHNTRRMPKGTEVRLTLRSGETTISTETTTVNGHGRFSRSIPIPQGAALGYYSVDAEILDGKARKGFDLAEVRLPTFEVSAAPAQGVIVHGEPLQVDVRSRYLSGEAAPIERLDWVVSCHRSAPNLEQLDEAFSAWTDAVVPGWSQRGQLAGSDRSRRSVVVETDELDRRAGQRCSVSVAIQDPSNQPVGADAEVFVHPGPGYVVFAGPRWPLAGAREVLRAMVVDNVGRPRAAERIGLTLHRIRRDGKSALLKRCEAERAPAGAQLRCRTPALTEGEHVVRLWAEVDGTPLELERRVFVQAPPTEARPVAPTPAPTPEPKLEVTGPEVARAGEPIAVTITAPWWSGEGVLTVEQTGLRSTEPFSLRRGKATLTVRAAEGAGDLLELTARVERPDGHPRARVETASHQIDVVDRTGLQVVVVAPPRARPGTETRFEVRVKGEDGDPVDARLAIWVVDDAVHQLRSPPRPLLEHIFNRRRPLEHAFSDMHRALLDPFDAHARWFRSKRAPIVRRAKAMVKGGIEAEVRKRFEPAPLFLGDIGTGPDGTLEVPLRLADDLTRFRIQVIASAELAEGTGPAIFGVGEADLEVTTPLPVRAVLPRTLRPGDTAQVAALVSVETTGTLEVRAETKTDRITFAGPTTRTRHVRAGQVVRVPFSVHAADVGKDAVTFSATLRPEHGKLRRAAVQRPLAVQPERTAVERAATHGSVANDRPLAIPVLVPEGERGSVDVSITTTALGDLQDAAVYLTDYPYRGVEQTASRLIPLVAMRSLAGRSPDAAERIADAVAHLQRMQLPSGRFAYWPGSQEPSAFGTAYATWVLQLAADAGAAVPKRTLERALEVLRADAEAPLPENPEALESALVARVMALRAVAESGAVPPESLAGVWAHRERLPVFSRLLFLQTLHLVDPNDPRITPLLTGLSSSIEQREGVAHVVDPTEPRWWWMLSSQTRTEAIALMTLQQVAPDDPRIAKLVAGLRASRRGGRWRNTQENAYALLALSRYAAQAEAEVPDQRVQAWIGTQRVIDATLVGFDPAPLGGVVALRRALGDRTGDRTHVVIQREGQGRTYYRVGVEWTPREAVARSQGIAIHRVVPETIRVGEAVMIHVSLSADAAVHHLAVEVPLPAGLEAVDTALGAGALARIQGEERRSPYLSHDELRPDRVVLFFDSLPAGTTTHAIPVVATTQGRFTLPAAVAEAMYEPETRARTGAGVVQVLPRR